MSGAAAAHDGARDEQADRRQHHGAAAVDVGQLAVERRDRGRGQQIGGDDPGQVLEIGEMPADGRQRGGDDGLVERGEERRQHQAEEDGAHLGVADRRRLIGWIGRRWRRCARRRAQHGGGLAASCAPERAVA